MDRQALIAQVQNAGNQALAAIRAGRYEQALGWCVRGLALAPGHPGLTFMAGVCHNELGRVEAAIQCFEQVLAAHPNHVDARYNMGVALERAGRFSEAAEAYRQVVAARPNHVPPRTNLAYALAEMGGEANVKEAKQLLADVLKVSDEPRAHNNLGIIALQEGRLADAEAHFARVLTTAPRDLKVLENMAFSLLKQERFAEAWPYLQARDEAREADYFSGKPPLPRWDFSEGQAVLLWVEQGIGDTLMYGSVLSEVIACSESVGLACDTRLHPLFTATFGDALTLFALEGPGDWESWTAQRSVESCFEGFRNSAEDFAKTAPGFLTMDGARAENLRAALGLGEEQTLIGISWRSEASSTGAERSCELIPLCEALAGEGRVLVNLQYGDVAPELAAAEAAGFPVLQAPDIDTTHDLDGLAALIAACDEVVTIDNSTVHLGGALGQNQTLLLPHYCDWRWGLSRDTSLLYANTRIVRQPAPGDWAGVLAQL